MFRVIEGDKKEDHPVLVTKDTVPLPKTDQEACQYLADVMAMVAEYGRVETCSPESQKIRRAFSYFARKAGLRGQKGNVRREPRFYFVPRPD